MPVLLVPVPDKRQRKEPPRGVAQMAYRKTHGAGAAGGCPAGKGRANGGVLQWDPPSTPTHRWLKGWQRRLKLRLDELERLMFHV